MSKADACGYSIVAGVVVALVICAVTYSSNQEKRRIDKLTQAWKDKEARRETPEEIAMIDAMKAHAKESRTKVLDMIIPAYGEPIEPADAKLSRNFQVLDDAWAREIQERQALEKRVAKLERRTASEAAVDGPPPVATTPNRGHGVQIADNPWNVNYSSREQMCFALREMYPKIKFKATEPGPCHGVL